MLNFDDCPSPNVKRCCEAFSGGFAKNDESKMDIAGVNYVCEDPVPGNGKFLAYLVSNNESRRDIYGDKVAKMGTIVSRIIFEETDDDDTIRKAARTLQARNALMRAKVSRLIGYEK